MNSEQEQKEKPGTKAEQQDRKQTEAY